MPDESRPWWGPVGVPVPLLAVLPSTPVPPPDISSSTLPLLRTVEPLLYLSSFSSSGSVSLPSSFLSILLTRGTPGLFYCFTVN